MGSEACPDAFPVNIVVATPMSATAVLSSLFAAIALVTVAKHLLSPGRFRSAWLGWGAACSRRQQGGAAQP